MSEPVETNEAPKKPGPIDINKLKIPAKQQSIQSPDNTPARVEIKLTNGDIVGFDLPNQDQAAKFIDSIYAVFNDKVPVLRLGIGGELYLIPLERFLFAKLVRA